MKRTNSSRRPPPGGRLADEFRDSPRSRRACVCNVHVMEHNGRTRRSGSAHVNKPPQAIDKQRLSSLN
ncbi:unnamed protein product [Nippostrongylus brasiliensis]|uniref:Integron gene cassette protein n=1 Tax=Nippostrongylus brasiliensis TaxID=27835 RepID=A0A0N4YKJ2_NIPBR|nr:hypothetical protein Q1695_011150 [Nippostrongylus brasiliensis]VDL81223.1 unnamed protein product [Nippostrongylus brasiliensis]